MTNTLHTRGFKVNSPSLGDPEEEDEIGIIQMRSDFLLELAEQSSGPLTACPLSSSLGPCFLQHKLRGFLFPSGMDCRQQVKSSLPVSLEFLSQISGCCDAGWSRHRPESHGISEAHMVLGTQRCLHTLGTKDIPTRQMNQYPGL